MTKANHNKIREVESHPCNDQAGKESNWNEQVIMNMFIQQQE